MSRLEALAERAFDLVDYIRARRRLPFPLPRVWRAHSRWLQQPGHSRCWEILVSSGPLGLTWIVYSPSDGRVWAEDAGPCLQFSWEIRNCRSSSELSAYIEWCRAGRPVESVT